MDKANLDAVLMIIDQCKSKRERAIYIEKGHNKPLSEQEIITCCGVYANGEKVFNGVYEEDLEFHIQYNKDFRFGRALFAKGKCVHRGYLNQEECDKIEIEIKDTKLTKNTRPYR